MKLLLGSKRVGTVHQFVGPEPALEVFRQNTRKTKHWVNNQHMAMWLGPSSIQRKAQKLIHSSRALVLLLRLDSTAYNPELSLGSLLDIRLRKHLYIMGLIDSPLCRCATVEETPAQVLCECEALATLRHTYEFLFLRPWVVLSRGAIWNFITGTGLPWFEHQFKGYKGPVKRPKCIGAKRARTH
jgi:hypothetical protein